MTQRSRSLLEMAGTNLMIVNGTKTGIHNILLYLLFHLFPPHGQHTLGRLDEVETECSLLNI